MSYYVSLTLRRNFALCANRALCGLLPVQAAPCAAYSLCRLRLVHVNHSTFLNYAQGGTQKRPGPRTWGPGRPLAFIFIYNSTIRLILFLLHSPMIWFLIHRLVKGAQLLNHYNSKMFDIIWYLLISWLQLTWQMGKEEMFNKLHYNQYIFR